MRSRVDSRQSLVDSPSLQSAVSVGSLGLQSQSAVGSRVPLQPAGGDCAIRDFEPQTDRLDCLTGELGLLD